LNNPLKYVDPSGRSFSEDVPWQFYTYGVGYENSVEVAYWDIMFNSNIPGWIQSYMRTLHDSDRVINVDFENLGGESIGLSAMKIWAFGIPTKTTTDTIKIDISRLSDRPGLAATLAHECYHIYEGNPGATIEEEYMAYYAEYFVGDWLSWKGVSSRAWVWDVQKNGALGSDTVLTEVQSQLIGGRGNSANVYGAMPLRQSQMANQALIRQGVYALNLGGPTWLSSGLGNALAFFIGNSIYATGVPWH
jgi:hypothetical protein